MDLLTFTVLCAQRPTDCNVVVVSTQWSTRCFHAECALVWGRKHGETMVQMAEMPMAIEFAQAGPGALCFQCNEGIK